MIEQPKSYVKNTPNEKHNGKTPSKGYIETKITKLDILGILCSILSIPASIIVLVGCIAVFVAIILLYVFYPPIFFAVSGIVVPVAIVAVLFALLIPAVLLILAMITSYMVIQKFDKETDGGNIDQHIRPLETPNGRKTETPQPKKYDDDVCLEEGCSAGQTQANGGENKGFFEKLLCGIFNSCKKKELLYEKDENNPTHKNYKGKD